MHGLSLHLSLSLSQPNLLNAQMLAQRNREMMTQIRRQRMMIMIQQQQQQQQQAAAGGFSPPPNVTAPTGMDNTMGGTAMNQPGQQPFNYGGNYGALTSIIPKTIKNGLHVVCDGYTTN